MSPFIPVAVVNSGGSTSQTRRVRVVLDTPDVNGNAYPALTTNNGFANVRRVLTAFTKDVDGYWEGSVLVPLDYNSSANIVCSYVANATSGVYRNQIKSAVVAVGVSEDTAYTAETAVDTSVPASANLRFDVSTSLTTTPVAGSTLNVVVGHIGSHGNDTLAVDCLLWECSFDYLSV